MLVYIELALSLVGLYCTALVSALNFNCRPLITNASELGLVLSIEGILAKPSRKAFLNLLGGKQKQSLALRDDLNVCFHTCGRVTSYSGIEC